MLYTLGKVFVFMTQMPAVNVVQPALHLEPMRGACVGEACGWLTRATRN